MWVWNREYASASHDADRRWLLVAGFLIRLNTPEPTTLVIEIKGFRDHDAHLKAETMRISFDTELPYYPYFEPDPAPGEPVGGVQPGEDPDAFKRAHARALSECLHDLAAELTARDPVRTARRVDVRAPRVAG